MVTVAHAAGLYSRGEGGGGRGEKRERQTDREREERGSAGTKKANKEMWLEKDSVKEELEET